MSLALLLMLAAHAQDEAVVPLLAIERPPELEAPLIAPTPLLVHRLSVELRPGRPESQIELTADLEGTGGGWIDLPVAGAGLTILEARLDGVPVALPPAEDGWRHLVTRARGRHRLTVRGLLSSPESGVALPMMTAARSSLTVIARGQDIRQAGRLLRGGRGDLSPGEALSLQWTPTSPPPPRPVVLVAESAVALRADAAGIEGRARLSWRISGGSVEEVRFRMPGRTEALTLTGAGVEGFRQEGALVIVRLEAPEKDSVTVDIGFRGPPPGEGSEAAPVPVPEAARGTGWLTLLRGDESILIPAAGPGLEPVSARALPAAASGLLDGSVLATYQTPLSASLTWRLSRYTPVDEPPTVVDDARYTLAVSAAGRAVLRARYQVRNDRNQFLRLTLPPGYRCMGVRVSGRTVNAVADASGELAIPLEKSVETLNGLVTFPVELLLIGEGPAWEARGARVLQSPSLDAPIASARWELRLPADVEVRDLDGPVRRVEEWTGSEQAIQYGSAYTRGEGGDSDEEANGAEEIVISSGRGSRRSGRRGADRRAQLEEGGERASGQAAQDDTREQVSQELWNQAYDAYKTNEFSKADDLLQASIAADPTNIAAKSLQSNVNVLLGKDKASEGEVGARRVKDMARAKTGRAEVEQEKLLKEAEEQTRRGDYAAAESNYERLVEITAGLANVEQQESNEQKVNLSTITSSLSSLRSQRQTEQGALIGGVTGEAAVASSSDEPVDRSGMDFADDGGPSTGQSFEPEPEPEPPAFFGASRVDNGYVVDGAQIDDEERPAPPVEAPSPILAGELNDRVAARDVDEDAGIEEETIVRPEVVYATEDLQDPVVTAQVLELEVMRNVPISGRSYSSAVQSVAGVEVRERKKLGGKGAGAGRAAAVTTPAGAAAAPAASATPAAQVPPPPAPSPMAARPAEPAKARFADEKSKQKATKSEALAPEKPVYRPQSLADALTGVEAFPLSIALPSALHPLRVEKELVAEGQPITITIRYRTRKDRP